MPPITLKRVRPFLTWALALLLLALPLAGCANVPTPAPATVTFVYYDQDTPYYKDLVQTFSRSHPTITVKLAPRSANLMGQLSPDDGDVLAGALSVSERLRQADTLSLSPWVEGDSAFQAGDFYPGLLDLYTRQGKLWAIPMGVDLLVLYYNRDLFAQAKAAYPRPGWTWDDFLGAAQALRNPGTGVYGYAAASYATDSLAFIYQHGGRIFDDWQHPTKPTLDDPRTVEALDWYAGLVQRLKVAPAPAEVSQVFGSSGQLAVFTGIATSKVAMWAGAYSTRGGRGWPQPWGFQWGMAPLPREQAAATWGPTEALAISAKAKAPEACWQWVKFLSAQPPARLVPARRSVAQSSAFERQAGAEAAAAARASLEHAMFIPPDLFSSFGHFGGLWEDTVNEVMSGQATAREALSRAQEQARTGQ